MTDAQAVFSQWSDTQLVEYVNGNGGNASWSRNRQELIEQAVRVAGQVEQRVLGQSSQLARDTSSKYPAIGLQAGAARGAPAGAAPAQARSVPPPMPRAGGAGRKKALICGCNYLGTSAQLRGCINDAKCMEYMLRTRFGFPPDRILLMVDDHPDPLRRPTRHNMIQGITWLMTDMQPGDSLVFHFSGHGSQQRDYTGEEMDGLNETLCPADFRTAGEIVDDELNRLLVNPLPPHVRLHAIIDACHSGTALDMPFSCSADRTGRVGWTAEYTRTHTHKGTAGGFAVQLGAARDSQTAADTSAMSGYASTGAATYCFISAIERLGTQLTYGQLLVEMHNTLQRALGGAGGGASVGGGLGGALSGLLLGGAGGYRGQEPVMCANYAFDLNTPLSI